MAVNNGLTSGPIGKGVHSLQSRIPTHPDSIMKTYSIATIPGDGIGKEVIPAGREVLEALAHRSRAFRFEFENFDWGSDRYVAHGAMMPADGLDALRGKDAILFGSAG